MRTITLLAVIALAPTALAQNNTIPPGMFSAEGPSVGFYFGGFPRMRAQLATGLYKGKVILSTELRFRQDGIIAGGSGARSWSNIRLDVGDCKFKSLDATFATNVVGTPTTMFRGSVSWPSLAKAPPTRPAPWGANGLKLPYSTSSIHTGVHDLLLDFRFSGGWMASGSWGPSVRPYHLDGVRYPTYNGNLVHLFGKLNCPAYNSGSTFPDTLVLSLRTYAKRTGNPADDDTIQGYPGHSGGSPSRAHIGAIGLTGQTRLSRGINVGTCQLLMMTPMIYWSYTTNIFGWWRGPGVKTRFNQALVGINVWAQAAHANAAGGINLSLASRSTVLAQPANPLDYKMIYSHVLTSATGSVVTFGLPVLFLK